MVKVLLRTIQEIQPGKWDELEELDKEFNEIEYEKYKYPKKRRYRLLTGINNTNTLIVERVWESMRKMENVMEESAFDPDLMKLNEKLNDIMIRAWNEIYMVME